MDIVKTLLMRRLDACKSILIEREVELKFTNEIIDHMKKEIEELQNTLKLIGVNVNE